MARTHKAAKGLHGQFYESESNADLFHGIKSDVEIFVDEVLTVEGL